MKKLLLVTGLATLMLLLTLNVAFAAMGYEDPALCVAGKWLVVDAAKDTAVKVYVPVGTAYGDGAGCSLPAPGNGFVRNVVRVKGSDGIMTVQVVGSLSSNPITVWYGDPDGPYQNVANDGKGKLTFTFALP